MHFFYENAVCKLLYIGSRKNGFPYFAACTSSNLIACTFVIFVNNSKKRQTKTTWISKKHVITLSGGQILQQ